MATYRAALIGLGRKATTSDRTHQDHPTVTLPYTHMASYRAVPGVEVVAGCDLYEEQREAFQRNWGIDRLYADYREMLEKERPDIVSVTTKTSSRHQIVLDVARSGVKAIYAEKPIAMSLAEADEMVAVCNENNVLLVIGCDRNSDPHWVKIRDAVRSGVIGELLQINMQARCAISHNGSHALGLLQFLAGDDAAWVFGEAAPGFDVERDEDLQMNGYVAFRNGARAFVRTWNNGPLDWSVDLIGTEGAIRCVSDALEVELIKTADRNLVSRQPLPRTKVLRSPTENLVYGIVESLETGKPHESSGEVGVAALELAIALRQSHREGFKRVDLPLADRSLRILSNETLGEGGDLPEALKQQILASRASS